MEKLFAVILVICMMLMAVAGMAEETQNPSAADAQKLDATYNPGAERHQSGGLRESAEIPEHRFCLLRPADQPRNVR